MASLWGDFLLLLRTTGALARTHYGRIVCAALVPFVTSHLIVLQARQIGLPERLALDGVHGLFVLSYLTAAVRIAQGRAHGVARVGLAVPKPSWPGFKVLGLVTAVVGVVGLPAAFALHPLVQAMEAAQVRASLYIPVTMLPEFVMTTLVGLALAAGTGQGQGQGG